MSITVLVASGDGSFRRLAGAALSRAGHEVRTMTASRVRVERAIAQQRPDVVVVEASDELAPHVRAQASAMTPGPGVVVVAEAARRGRAVEKWGPVDLLVEEVELAAGEPRPAAPRPRLRMIPGGA